MGLLDGKVAIATDVGGGLSRKHALGGGRGKQAGPEFPAARARLRERR